MTKEWVIRDSSFGWEVRDDSRGDENVDERDLKEKHPPQAHQLVVTKTRQRPAHPDKNKEEDRDLREEDKDIVQAPAPAVRSIRHPRQMPAAQEKRHNDRGAGDHGDVLAQEKEPRSSRAIFGVVAADQFGCSLGKIERA